MTTRAQIKSLLYSYSEWEKVGSKPQPYHIEIEKNGQWLYYFGANHSRDPENFQYSVLRQRWYDFLEKTGGENAVVLVEGGLRKVRPDENTAILKDSEGGLISYLAHLADIPLESADLSRSDELQALTKQFTKEEVQYFYFSRGINDWLHRPTPKIKFKKLADWILESNKKASLWTDFEFTLEHMERIHKSIFGTDFDYTNKDFFESTQHPIIMRSVINRIKVADSEFRDTYIVSQIKKHWDEGKNIFVVLGRSHLILQERALRTLLK